MKSTLATVFIVLFVACILKFDSPVSPQAQVNAQTPEASDQDPLFEAIERFMEQRPDSGRHPDRPERPLLDRHPEPELVGMLLESPREAEHRRELEHRRDQERHREAQRDREHQLEQQRHRIENMHVAARHLEQAGMNSIAHQIHRQAEEQEHHLREQIERTRLHEQPHQELLEVLHQVRNEVRELKQEVRELRKIVSQRHAEPEPREPQNLR